MTTYKELMLRSMGWYMITTALFVVFLLIGNVFGTGEDMMFYFVLYLIPAASAVVGGVAVLLSFAASAFGSKGPIIGLAIMLLAHVIGGLIGKALGWPSTFADLTTEPDFILSFAGLFVMALHFGWVVYCVWASARIWKTNRKNQAVATTK